MALGISFEEFCKRYNLNPEHAMSLSDAWAYADRHGCNVSITPEDDGFVDVEVWTIGTCCGSGRYELGAPNQMEVGTALRTVVDEAVARQKAGPASPRDTWVNRKPK